MNKLLNLVFLSFFINIAYVEAESYPEVLFENSTMPESYFYSKSGFSGDSWIKHLNSHLPVSDSIFFTPGNALILQYVSAKNGDWQTELSFPDTTGFLAADAEVLRLKLFVNSENTKVEELPAFEIVQSNGHTLALRLDSYISNFQDNMWIGVEIPLKDFKGYQEDHVIKSVRVKQHAQDGKEHQIFLDQLEFLKKNNPSMKLTGKAMLVDAEPYEQHVDITWQLPLTPSIRYIKIYRSEDNKNFKPVGIRSISYKKYTDYVPRSGASYYYKIAWVDYLYRESPFSDVIKADTKIQTDEELITSIQKSHVTYFIDEVEFNSGMFKASSSVNDATVSVEGTGVGIMALIVGVERGFLSREMLLARLERTVDFLNGATTYHGAYPSFLNGRTGQPTETDSCEVGADVNATTSLIQGLLVARNYFDKDTEAETQLREAITNLWERVDWRIFLTNENSTHLFSRWSPACGFVEARPLGGYNQSFSSYLLAIASPEMAIPKVCFERGYQQPLGYIGPALGRMMSTSLTDTLVVTDEGRSNNLYAKEPFLRDSVYYGIPLTYGHPDSSLMEAHIPFMTFDPRGKKIADFDLFQNQVHLSSINYRAALDQSEQFVSLTEVLWAQAKKDTLFSDLYNPAAAIATYPYTPQVAIEAIKNYYRNLGGLLWTEYGFRDGFDLRNNWVAERFDPVNQASVPIMLENGRTGLIWKLFMSDADIAKISEDLF